MSCKCGLERIARLKCVDCVTFWCHECRAEHESSSHQVVQNADSRALLASFSSLDSACLSCFSVYGERRLFGWRDHSSAWSWVTYKQVGHNVHLLSRGLLRLVQPGACVALCSSWPTPWWYSCQLACELAGLVCTGIAPSFSDDQMSAIIRKARVSVVICSESLVARFRNILSKNQALVFVGAVTTSDNSGASEYSLDDLMAPTSASLQQLPPMLSCVPSSGEEVFSMIFTSGSTGMPKGVFISKKRWLGEICVPAPSSVASIVIVSFTQPSWYMSQWSVWRCFMNGGRVAFAEGEKYFEAFKSVNPTTVFAPPIVWTNLFADFRRRCDAQGEDHNNPSDDIRTSIVTQVGNRAVSISVGSASVPQELRKFLQLIFGDICQVYDGYGATEFGHLLKDGRLSNRNAQIMVAPCSDLGYTFPRGELCVKTRDMTCEYVNDPAESALAWDGQGWYHTGDIVEMSPEDVITFIDRKKNFFKLLDGTFVAASLIESTLRDCNTIVHQVLVTSVRNSIACFVVPCASKIEALSDRKSVV